VPPAPADELHEHLDALHKAITAGHKEVVKALHKIGQSTVHPVVVEQSLSHLRPPPKPLTKSQYLLNPKQLVE